jgi:hypothetical protein
VNVLSITIIREFIFLLLSSVNLTHLCRPHTVPHDLATFVNEQQAILNGIHVNLSKSPVDDLEVRSRKSRKHVYEITNIHF